MEKNKLAKPFTDITDLKSVIANQYQKQIKNFFGDEKRALRFLSGVVAAVQRKPKLMECTAESVINSFMIMAQLELMPSDVSGEAYVIPYGGVAQFQIGYQGLVTLFYRSGVKKIVGEIIRENDTYEMVDGELTHKIDLRKSMEERGAPIGAFVRVMLPSGETATKYMNATDILAHGKKFSKAFDKPDSPWNPKNDPELWMWKKTVLKQAAKLVPKNEKLIQAIGEDNKDSVIGDRLEESTDIAPKLKLGAVLKTEQTEYAQSDEEKVIEVESPSVGDAPSGK